MVASCSYSGQDLWLNQKLAIPHDLGLPMFIAQPDIEVQAHNVDMR